PDPASELVVRQRVVLDAVLLRQFDLHRPDPLVVETGRQVIQLVIAHGGGGNDEHDNKGEADFEAQHQVAALALPDRFQQMTKHQATPFNAWTGWRRDIFQAGITPDSRPNTAAISRPQANTAKLISTFRYGIRPEPSSQSITPLANTRPSNPPNRQSRMFSTTHCTTSLPLDAPKALRTPISELRSMIRPVLRLTRFSAGNSMN